MSLIDENSSIEDKMSATADGGKNAFGIILGWIPALFIILFFSKLIYLIKKIFNMFPYFNDEKLKNNNKKFSLKLKMANKSIHRTAE